MGKSERSETGIALQVAGRTRPEKAAEKRRGLVLDDILTAIHDMRKTYHLSQPKFGLEQIEREAGAKSALEGIITNTLARHATEIYSKPDPLFAKVCDIRSCKRINKPRFYSGWRIPPAHATEILRLLLERALQTIVQLPPKDPSLKDGTPELKLLALRCEKLAKEIDDVFKTRVVRNRISVYFRGSNSQGLDQLLRQADELRRTAETFRSILTKTDLVKQKADSPSPQVRFALYLIGWFEASTGKKQYAPFKTLLSAAYNASKMQIPAWVNRLEIEMHRRRARREIWFRSISV
jgi:hypothetical protein